MNILSAHTNRPLRIAEIDAGQLPSLRRDFIAEILDARLTGVVVRAAFPASIMARVVERLESGACSRYERTAPFWQGRVIGPGIQYASDLREYFDEVHEFRSDCAELYEGGPDFETRIEELLASTHAGRPLSTPSGPEGEAYAVTTIRGIVSGNNMNVHCDIPQYTLPALHQLASQFDLSSLLSFFFVLATPESGGELSVYALRYDDDAGKANVALEGEEARRAIAPHGELVLPMSPGDLIVFDAGHHFHCVAPVGGSRTRWSQGGFISRSSDGASLFYWH